MFKITDFKGKFFLYSRNNFEETEEYFLKFPKKFFLFFILFAQTLIHESWSCATAQNLNIVATIKPIHSLVSMVVGSENSESLALLVKGASSPHTYGLKPSDAKILNSAKVIFRVSDNIEPFLTKALNSLPASVKIVTLIETKGLRLLQARKDPFLRNERQALVRAPEEHEQRTLLLYNRKELSQIDGHIWLDPENAIIILKEINRNLKELSPENAAIFEANTALAISDIQKMSVHISEVLSPLRGKPYIVFHDALFYFENRFNLSSIGSITVSPEIQISAKHVAEIRAKIKDFKISCVFQEPISSSKILQNILEGTTAQIGNLDPEGLLVAQGPSAYLEILNGITSGLQSCLK